MANSGVTLGNFNLGQLDYENMVTYALSHGARIWKDFPQVNWEGDQKDWGVHVQRNVGAGWVEDAGQIPAAGKQTFARARAGRRFAAFKVQLSQGALAAYKTNSRAIIAAKASEFEGLTRDALDFYNRWAFRDGTGVVASIRSTGSNPANIQVNDAKLLWDGAYYDLYDSTLATNRGEFQVSSVAQAATLSSGVYNFLFTSAATLPSGATTGDKIVWKGQQNIGNALNRVITGLDGLVDDASGTFQNVSTTTYPRYTSYVDSNSGTARAITPAIFRRTLAALRQKAGNNSTAKEHNLYCDSWLSKEFEEMYEGSYRLMANDASLGYKGLSFLSGLGKINLEVDTDCIRNTMFLVDPNEIEHIIQRPLSFIRDDNGTVMVQSRDNLTAQAAMLCISQLRIKNRQYCAKIKDLQDQAVISF